MRSREKRSLQLLTPSALQRTAHSLSWASLYPPYQRPKRQRLCLCRLRLPHSRLCSPYGQCAHRHCRLPSKLKQLNGRAWKDHRPTLRSINPSFPSALNLLNHRRSVFVNMANLFAVGLMPFQSALRYKLTDHEKFIFTHRFHPINIHLEPYNPSHCWNGDSIRGITRAPFC